MDREERNLTEYPMGDRPEPEPESGIYRTAGEEPDSTPIPEEVLDELERYLTDGCFCS